MKFIKYFIFIIVIVGCSSEQKNIKNIEALPLETTILPEEVSVDSETQFYNLKNVLNVNNEYLVFVDDVDKGVFKVFSLPDLEFQHAWGRMGRGPDELSFISLRQINAHNDKLVFYEDVYARLLFYQVTDSALVLSRELDDFTFRKNEIP